MADELTPADDDFYLPMPPRVSRRGWFFTEEALVKHDAEVRADERAKVAAVVEAASVLTAEALRNPYAPRTPIFQRLIDAVAALSGRDGTGQEDSR